jgi:hypothetical protein
MEERESQPAPVATYDVGRSWMWARMADISIAGLALVAAEAALWEKVRQARATGMTWEEVGGALNCTKQAAYSRFSKPPRGQLL